MTGAREYARGLEAGLTGTDYVSSLLRLADDAVDTVEVTAEWTQGWADGSEILAAATREETGT